MPTRAAPLTGSGIATTEGLDIGRQNIEFVELGGRHAAYEPSISSGYITMLFIVSIYVFYEWKVVL